jgi:hypothetical protein
MVSHMEEILLDATELLAELELHRRIRSTAIVKMRARGIDKIGDGGERSSTNRNH